MKTPTIPVSGTVANVAAHKHCEVCGTATALDGRVCSPECQAKAVEAWRMRKRSMYMMLGALALVLLFTLYGGKLFGGA